MKNYLLLLISIFLISNLSAQIYVKHDATGKNDGTSWENAFANLQAGIDAANEGDQIWVAMGTYKPSGPTPDSSHFMITTAVELYGGFDGTESQLEERDWENNQTIISGDLNEDDVPGDFFINREDNAWHVVFIDTESGKAVFDGFVVSGGMTKVDNFDRDNPIRNRGGGMYVTTLSKAVVRNSLFTDNSGYQGAGLYARSELSGGTTIVFENNIVEKNYGFYFGAITVSYMDSAIIRNSTFKENDSEGFGGALVVGNINAIISNCSFSSNSSLLGGSTGLYNNFFRTLSYSVIHFKQCVFDANSAKQRGGAIVINNFMTNSTYVIDSCKFTNNSLTNSVSYGGALSAVSFDQDNSSSLDLIVDRSEFINNSGQRGGGIAAISLADTIKISVSNSRFLRNETVLGGAGYFESRDWMHIQMDNLHVEENSAVSSGGGFVLSNENTSSSLPIYMKDCIFLNNVCNNFYGGGVFARYAKPVSVNRCEFIGNEAERGGSALCLSSNESIIENCLFQENLIVGVDTFGGGAIYSSSGNDKVKNTYFTNNMSTVEGAAISNIQDGNMHLEGVVMQNNTGNSTIINRISRLQLTNVSMIDNEFGIKQDNMSHLTLQNTIMANEGKNLLLGGTVNLLPENQDSIVTHGANISNDESMVNYLTGQAGYPDLNETDPLLDDMLVPLPESPAVDNGNPDNVELTFDAKGEPRFMGAQIDIGALESPFTSSSRDIDWDSGRLTVFPNPVAEHIHFELTKIEAGAVHINIFNSSGHSVLSDVVRHSAGALTFKQEVSHLPAGSYYLVVSATEGHFGAGITVLK